MGGGDDGGDAGGVLALVLVLGWDWIVLESTSYAVTCSLAPGALIQQKRRPETKNSRQLWQGSSR